MVQRRIIRQSTFVSICIFKSRRVKGRHLVFLYVHLLYVIPCLLCKRNVIVFMHMHPNRSSESHVNECEVMSLLTVTIEKSQPDGSHRNDEEGCPVLGL